MICLARQSLIKGAMVRGYDHIAPCFVGLKMKAEAMYSGRKGVGVVESPLLSHMSGGASSPAESPAKLQISSCSSCGRTGKRVDVLAIIVPFDVVVRR